MQRGDFDSVVQVHLLVLDACGIEEIEEDALGRLDQLETLSLNANRLVNVPASLPGAALTTIYLEANRITVLRSGDFAGLLRLDQLHLARNAIASIESGAFHQLTRLAGFHPCMRSALHTCTRTLAPEERLGNLLPFPPNESACAGSALSDDSEKSCGALIYALFKQGIMRGPLFLLRARISR